MIFQQKSLDKIEDNYKAALNMHAIEASGNSFFQIVIQIHFLMVLVLFGSSTFIDGIDVATIFSTVCTFKFNF